MTRTHCLMALAAALMACTGFSAVAQSAPAAAASVPAPPAKPAANQPETGATNASILAAMHQASTWGHPDLFGEFAGMERYAKGDYKAALKYFKYGALYADKPSQLALGIMFANGLGVRKDAATGCAWLTLAAERNYPRMVATRDMVCGALTATQHSEAEAQLAALRPTYGDKVAKQRMATELRLAVSQRTGSHLGFDAGAIAHAGSDFSGFNGSAVVGSASRNCGSTLTIDGIPWPPKGCVDDDFWAPYRWNPKQYFAARDAHRIGTVTVGELQDVKAPAATAKPQPASAGTAGTH